MSKIIDRAGLRSQRGGIAIQVVILLVLLLAFAGLSVEVVAMLMTKRHMQSAADSSALAAAMAVQRGYPVAYADEAAAISRNAGFVDGAGGTTILVNKPPASGPYAGNNSAVEVVMTQAQTLALIPVLSGAAFTLHVRAVALADSAGVACALALDPSASKAVSAQGGVAVTMNDCGVAANSTASNAIFVGGASSMSAAALSTPGGFSTQGSGQLNISGIESTDAAAIPDPYADRTVPTPGTCTYAGQIKNTTRTLSPGTYCASGSNPAIDIKDSTVTLNPGVYILVDAGFSATGPTTVINGSGVTIVLTGTGSGSKIGSVNITSNPTLTLSAPTTGSTAGMVFFQDPRAPSSGGPDNIQAGASTSFTGALYFPTQELIYQGGTSSSSPCTQLIADTIQFQGGVTLNSGCVGVGITPIGMGAPRLVE